MLRQIIISTIRLFILFVTFWNCPALVLKGADFQYTIIPKEFVPNSLYDHITTNFDSLAIPLKRAGRLLFVEAEIDGESGNLIFDSGVTDIVLNKTYFRNHIVYNNSESNGVTGSVGKVDEITINHLSISNLSFSKLMVHAANLGHIENKRNIKILGLFGFELIRDFEIVLDINNGLLILYKIDKKGNRVLSKSGPTPDIIQNIFIQHNILFLKGVIAGKSLRFCLDTGAETNAISTNAPQAVLKSITITRKSALNGVGTMSNQVLFGIMNEFICGSTKLTDMETIVTDLNYLNEAYNVHIDGILGYNFLKKGTICINFVKNLMEMILSKNGGL